MLLRYLFCCLLLNIGISISLPAQSNLSFLKIFPNIQRGYTICPTGDGNLYVGGAITRDSAQLRGRDLILDGDSILTTYTGNLTDSSEATTTFFLQQHHLDGTIAWRMQYDLAEWDNEQAEEVIAVPDGYVLYGQASQGSKGSLFVLKTDQAGSPVWARKLQVGQNDGFAQSGSQQGQIVFMDNSLFFAATTEEGSGVQYTQPDTVQEILPATTGCDTLEITVLQFQVICTDTLDLGPDVLLCEDSLIIFHAGAGFVSYLWQDGSTDSTYTTSAYGVYSVEVTDSCGQVQRDTVLLTVSLLGDTPFPDSTICAGESLTVSMPGFDAYLWTPANALNCDTCATVVLQPAVTTKYTLLATTQEGCITRDTFLITVLPLPTRTEVIEFFPGDTVLLGGTSYSQPDTVVLILPASVGCDTVVTYLLQLQTMVSIACPANLTVSVQAGDPGTVVDYNLPTGITTCPDTALIYTLLSGLPVGSNFPVGITQVCYRVADACGNADTCCFQLMVEEQAQPCDVKTIGCLRYELLPIQLDAPGNRRYSIRVTNTCADALVYTAFELPNGITAVAPADGSVFTTANGRKYDVRNPNASPFHSIRFKAQVGTVLNLGASDVFEYRLPQQTAPNYIHVTARLESGQSYPALLNTFYCPVQPYTNFGPGSGVERTVRTLMVFPNPTDGGLFVDCSDWAGQTLQLQIINSQGQSVQVRNLTAEFTPLALDLPVSLPNGLYFMELLSAEGQRTIQRFVVQR